MTIDIPFSFGVNTKKPNITPTVDFATTIDGLLPEDGTLKAFPLKTVVANLPGVTNFGYTYFPSNRSSDIYAFSSTGIHNLGASSTTQLLAFSSTDPWAVVNWDDKIYCTKPGVSLQRVQGLGSVGVDVRYTSEDVVGSNLDARYACSAHDHLWLANLGSGYSREPLRVTWSDLYKPESWVVSETTESDSFTFSVDSNEITGLETHRNQVVIFTFKSIWISRYVGLPDVYTFEPLHPGIGCSHHYSCVNVEDKIFFFSSSGVYKLESFQLSNIGEDIWPTLRNDLANLSSAKGSVDSKRKLIYWVVGTKTYVYNYSENRWVILSTVYITATLRLPATLIRTDSFDSVSATFDSVSTSFDEGINATAVSYQELVADASAVYKPDETQVQNSTFTITTPFFHVGDLWSEKEPKRLRIAYEKTGNPSIAVSVYTKDSQIAQQGGGTPCFLGGAIGGSFVGQWPLTEESIFYIPRGITGKMLSVTLSCTNTTPNAVKRLSGISIELHNGKPEK